MDAECSVGIGARLFLSPPLDIQLNSGIGIKTSVETQPVRIVRELNVKIGIGNKVLMSSPVNMEINNGIGIHAIVGAKVNSSISVNTGVGIRGGVYINNDGDAEEVDCTLPEFSNDRWC